MKKVLLITKFLIVCVLFWQTSIAQMSINNTGNTYRIDFDNTYPGVNEGSFSGLGFSNSPINGELDADAWEFIGLSDGDKLFGVPASTDDYSGSSSGGVTGGGLYSFDVGGGNKTLGVQPTGSDFTPGYMTLKVDNNTGKTVGSIKVRYTVYVYNDATRSNDWSFGHSDDNINYDYPIGFDVFSTEAADGSPSWVPEYREIVLVLASPLSNGSSYYLRWGSDDISGSGSRDEFAIDDIEVQMSESDCGLFIEMITNSESCPGNNDGSIQLYPSGLGTSYVYMWSTGETDDYISSLSPASYQFTVTDNLNCSVTQSAMVSSQPALTITTVTTVTESCLGYDGAAYVTVTGGSSPYDFWWFDQDNPGPPISSNSYIMNQSGGNYQVQVQDQCGGFELADIFIPTEGFDVSVSFGMTSSCGASDGIMNTTVTGGDTPYTYNWSNGMISPSLTAMAGIYIVTVQDAKGCAEMEGGAIVDPGAPNINMTLTDVLCMGDANGTGVLDITGGTLPYSITWGKGFNGMPFATTNAVSGLSPDLYLVTVVDGAGCKSYNGGDVEAPNNQLGTDEWYNDISCFGASDGSASIMVMGFEEGWGGPFQFDWSNGFSESKGSWDPSTISGLNGGNYTVSVTDVGGCQLTYTYNIIEPSQLVLTTNKKNDVCGNNGGWAMGLVTGGTAPYNFYWDIGQNQQTITNLGAGVYGVEVWDNNGCYDGTQFVTITSVTPMSVSISSSDATCGAQDGSASAVVTSGGTSPYSFKWSNGPTTPNNTGLGAGLYGITVTDANNCKDYNGTTVNNPGAPSTARNLVSVTCPGMMDGEFHLTVTGGATPYSYEWFDDNLNPIAGNSSSITGLSGGLYLYSVTDGLGCIASGADNIDEDSPIDPNENVQNNSCWYQTFGQIDLSGTYGGDGGPYTYMWNGGETTNSLFNLMNDTYDVTISDSKGCSVEHSFSISSSVPEMYVSLTVVDDNCAEGNGSVTAVTIGGTGTFNIDWFDSNFNWQGNGQSQSNLYVGEERWAQVYDGNWTCQITSTTVTINGPMTYLDVTVTGNDATCGLSDGSANAIAVGGTMPYTFVWNNGETATGVTTHSITGLSAGAALVTVYDANMCERFNGDAINNPGSPTITLNTTNAKCYGGNDGAMTAVVSGGITPYSYLWKDQAGNTVGTTASVTGLTAQKLYIVTVTGGDGCSSVDGDMINSPDQIDFTLWWKQNPSCANLNDGQASINGYGGTGSLNYNWSSGETGTNPWQLSGGNNFVTITDVKGCSETYSVTLTNPSAITVTASTNPANCGSPDGSASASAIGGNGGFNYSWSNGQFGQNATNLMAGNYGVTATDGWGCKGTAVATVNNLNGASVTVTTNTNIACNGGSNGQVTAAVSGGETPYSYLWSDATTAAGVSSHSLTGLIANTYAVTITDNNGCIANGSSIVSQPDVLAATIDGTNVTCGGDMDGTASVTVTGGISPYSYVWDGGSNISTTTGLGDGIIGVTITDGNLCQTNASISIEDPGVISTTLTPTDVDCNGDSDGAVMAAGDNGTAPFDFLWSNGATTISISNVVANTYSITVVDANGCTHVNSAVVSEPDAIVVSTTTTEASCGLSDGSATAIVTGGLTPYSYSWQGGGSLMTNTALAAGTYTVTIFDANLCEAYGSATVSNPVGLAADAGNAASVCVGGEVALGGVNTASGGSGNYSYTWNNTSDLDNASAANPVATVTMTTTYKVTVTDLTTSCVATDAVTITANANPVVGTSVMDVDCAGGSDGSVTANVSGGTSPYSYAWDNGASSMLNSNLIANTYSVTVTDVNGCKDNTSDVVSEPTALGVTVTTNDVMCAGANDGDAMATVSGGVTPYSYSWSGGGSMPTNTGLVANTYSVTIFDANLCEASASGTVGEPATMELTVTTTNSSCGNPDGTAGVAVTGGTGIYTYAWSTSATTSNVSGLVAASYGVTVTDSNGCEKTDLAVVSDAGAPVISVTNVANALCNNSNEGELMAVVSGGATPYTYTWSDAQTNESAVNLTKGSYSVAVEDANGCIGGASGMVSAPAALTLSFDITDVSCNGGNDGALSAMVSGGTTPYNYMWSNTSTASMLSGLSASMSAITVTDANGCTIDGVETVSEPTAISISELQGNVLCNGGNDGTLIVMATGGPSTDYTYNWSNSTSGAINSNLVAGNYTVTATSNNCETTASYTITQPDPIMVATSMTPAACGGTDGDVSVAISGGVTPYSYNWANGSTTSMASSLVGGAISVTVTDGNSCTKKTTIVVTNTGGPSVTVTGDDLLCANDMDGVADVMVSGGTTPYTYQWDDDMNQTTATALGLGAGVYTVIVTDGSSCISSASATVTEPDALTLNIMSTNDVCFNAGEGQADANVNGGTGAYYYMWSDTQTGASALSLTANTYGVTVTDDNGCSVSGSTTITEPSALSITASATDETSFGANDGTANVTVEGGMSMYSYEWSNFGETTASISGLMPGEHSVTVQDNGACDIVANVTVNAAAAPCTITLTTSSTNETCGNMNGSATVSATGSGTNYTYQWEDNSSNATLDNLSGGIYSVTVTSDDGCIDVTSVTVIGGQGVDGQLSTTNPTCGNSDGTASLSVTGGATPYTYAWEDLDGNVVGGNTATVTGLSFGAILVTVTDANGCSNDEGAPLSEQGAPSVTVTGNSTSCNGTNDGTVVTDVEGGTTPYTYAWQLFDFNNNTGTPLSETSSSLTGLAANDDGFSYLVTVTDADGCRALEGSNVEEPTAIIVSASSTSVTSAGASDGTATVSATGGDSMFTYVWNTGESGMTISGLSGGTYKVTATDGNGCTGSTSIFVAEDGVVPTCGLTLTIAYTDATTVGGSEGSATAVVTGGLGNITYAWNNSSTADMISGLTAGVYSVTVTDDIVGGCVKIDQVTVSEPTCTLSVSVSGSTTLTADVSGAQGAVSYEWSNGATTASISGVTPASYTVTVTDAVGCTADAMGTVIDNIVELDGKLQITAFPNPNSGNFTVAITGSGTYTVAVMNVIGQSITQEQVTVVDKTNVAINLDGVESGIYFVKVKDANYEQVIRVVVNK